MKIEVKTYNNNNNKNLPTDNLQALFNPEIILKMYKNTLKKQD